MLSVVTADFQGQRRLTQIHGHHFFENRNNYCRKSAFPESNGTVSFKEMTISLGADSMRTSLSKPISSTKRCISAQGLPLIWNQAALIWRAGWFRFLYHSEFATGGCCRVRSFLSMKYQATKKPRSNKVRSLSVIIHQFASSFREQGARQSFRRTRSIRDAVCHGSLADEKLRNIRLTYPKPEDVFPAGHSPGCPRWRG